MKKADMRDEYDFSNGVRGKYAERMRGEVRMVVLEPDVAKRFKTSDQVNDALRRTLAPEDRDRPIQDAG